MTAFTSRSALITGVGGGFGRGIALAVAAAGAAVTLTARSSGEIEDVRRAIEEAGGRAQALTADVRDMAAATEVYRAHEAAFGTPDVLINSASLTHPYGPIGTVDPHEWWDTVAVHVLGSINYMTLAIPNMRAAGRGRIINVCSLDALTVRPNQSAYCVAKTAQLRLTEHAAAENADSGLAIFAIHPGIAMSPLAREMLGSDQARKWLPADFMQLCDQVEAAGGWTENHAICGRRCVALLSGRFDHLSGTLVNFHDFAPEAAATA